MIAFELTSEQQAIVSAGVNGPRLVNAGAGTGKTFTMIERVRALVKGGFAPDALLLVTFTNAAASELATRLESVFDVRETRRPTCSTFHALASDVLREFSYTFGTSADLRVVDDGRARGIFARAFRDLQAGRLEVDLSAFPLIDRPRAMERSLATIALELKSAGTSIEKFRASALAEADALADLSYGAIKQLGVVKKDGTQKILSGTLKPDPERMIDDRKREALNERKNVLVVAALFERFQSLLDEASLLTFGDVITRATALVNAHPVVAATLRERFRHAIVDEFQDTNGTQIAFLEAIFGSSLEPVLVVGDVRQAIFEFNGADSQGIVRFRERATESLPLGENRRSFQPILDLAHHALETLSGQRYETAGATLRAQRGGSDPTIVRVRAFDGANAREREAAAIADAVGRLIADGCAPGDIALLMRGRMRAHLYAEALNARGIATQLRGGTGFFDAPEIREVVAWSRLASDPTDPHALVAALQGSAFALSDGALGMLAREGDFAKNALFEQPPESFDKITLERLDRFRATVRYVTALGTRPLGESCRAIVVASGAELARASDSETAAQARANLDQFVRFAADLSRDLPRATLRDLIAELDEREALELDLPIAELAGDRVSLVTIHGAKGLEWKHVFVVDVAPSAFPIVTNDMREVVAYLSDRGALAIKMGVDGRPTLRWFSGRFEPDERGVVVKRDPDYEEEHRLFYVALTRARDSITITGRTDRYGNASTCIKAVRGWLSSSGFDEGDHGVADSPEFTALPFASSASTINPQQLQLLLQRSERSSRDDTAPERRGPLSFSAMELQERCPRRARYHYVFGLPDLEDVDVDVDAAVQEDLPKRDPGRFGRIVHKILEYDAKARIAETERDLERFIADAVEEEEGTSAEAEAARSAVAAARAVLETYEPVAAEQRFLLSIGGEVMSGYIDLLARDRDGRLIVIDYKTGSTAGEHYALQFALYARAVREIYEEQPEAMLLRIGEQTAMAEAIAIASDVALYAAIEAAGTMENNEPRPSAACRYCPYAYDVCDAAPRPELSVARS